MRIECHSISDFLINLDTYPVFNRTIYYNRTIRSLTKDSVRESTSVEIGIQATAVVTYEMEEAQALIECGETCGVDRRTADGRCEGTEVFDNRMEELRAFCQRRGLKLCPGVLGI